MNKAEEIIAILRSWLRGKKTFLTALLIVVLGVSFHFHYITKDDLEAFGAILSALGLVSLRLAIKELEG